MVRHISTSKRPAEQFIVHSPLIKNQDWLAFILKRSMHLNSLAILLFAFLAIANGQGKNFKTFLSVFYFQK